MRRLSEAEKQEIFNQYKDMDEPIEVVDFDSACERCKQKLVGNLRARQARYRRTYRKRHPEAVEKDRQYTQEVISGKRNIPCAENMRSFHRTIIGRYGSLSAYHYNRQVKERKRELAFKD